MNTIQQAELARQEFNSKMKELQEYVGSRSKKVFMKEVQFLILSDELKKAKDTWYKLNIQAIQEAKAEKLISKFN
ncbi:hypothetical protein [Chryseobacterium indologenes]|uniref:hypothetical protein n=1 Tax=Chryseobacterium indologenes TaxID=253 RepID=UPI001623467A|nr:hypothetical protein [Chryseobacterium indologenes]